MKAKKTNRGFKIVTFEDQCGQKCRLQKSSLATEDCIWLGVAKPKIKRLEPNRGWVDIEIPGQVNVGSRMHLTQDQVKELLPFLQHFAETGELE